ncbi:MAG: hypothetical protein JNL96_14415 [Planctomycetaceae bacterium]|nr:hypothetical protein [Planctomycetaceae bacterium]
MNSHHSRKPVTVDDLERIERRLWRGETLTDDLLERAEAACVRISKQRFRSADIRQLAIVCLGRIARAKGRNQETTAKADPSHVAPGGDPAGI